MGPNRPNKKNIP